MSRIGSSLDMAASDEKKTPFRAYETVRARTEHLVACLSPEDQLVQSMADASPAKWHRAHTTWFFEEFLLKPFLRDYKAASLDYGYLFNSYYEAVGARHPRAQRGILTRPSSSDVTAYRDAVDAAVLAWLARGQPGPEQLARLALGLAHEEQHQELILTDILHAFAQNPLAPAYDPCWSAKPCPPKPAAWLRLPGGSYEVGASAVPFSFDNERPRHEVILAPFAIADRLVTNEAWLAFIEDGGYETPTLWLSDGWLEAGRQGWTAPAYWRREPDGAWSVMTLAGRVPLDPRQPVCHVGYYEADAFARWAGKRLPTEQEWEAAAQRGMLGDAFGLRWQWTGSPYMPYPGFRPASGAIGEYNGKFMINQMVLRGSSLATPPGHSRASYRNFFYPHQRWQFTGLRLASDQD